MKETNIIFFGAPGVGKGTQAKKLSDNLKLPHIDTGNLIREAITNKTELGIKAKQFVESGKLVPDELVIDLIRENFIKQKDKNFNGFILDGFPRTIPQADALKILLEELKLDLTCVLNIQASENILVKRLSSRRLCSNKSCGAIFNLITKKSKEENKCDVCGSLLYQRKDDTEEAAKERLNEYINKTAPLEKYYREQNKLVDIDGTKESEEVYNEIIKVIRKLTLEKYLCQ